MSVDKSMDEDDPILRMAESRREEAKRDVEMQAEIARKRLESDKRIMRSRIAAEEARQKKIREASSR
jgi:hypothetical protein